MSVQYEFTLSTKEVQSILVTIGETKKLKNYKQLLQQKMSNIIENRETDFRFPKGVVIPKKPQQNFHLYAFCRHEDEEQKSSLTFSMQDYDTTGTLKFKWQVCCLECIGIAHEFIYMVDGIKKLKKRLEQYELKPKHDIYARTSELLKKMMDDICNESLEKTRNSQKEDQGNEKINEQASKEETKQDQENPPGITEDVSKPSTAHTRPRRKAKEIAAQKLALLELNDML